VCAPRSSTDRRRDFSPPGLPERRARSGGPTPPDCTDLVDSRDQVGWPATAVRRPGIRVRCGGLSDSGRSGWRMGGRLRRRGGTSVASLLPWRGFGFSVWPWFRHQHSTHGRQSNRLSASWQRKRDAGGNRPCHCPITRPPSAKCYSRPCAYATHLNPAPDTGPTTAHLPRTAQRMALRHSVETACLGGTFPHRHRQQR
jgi:hypothetical protein